MPQPEHTVRRLDARSLQGIAHPLRMRLLSALRERGPATASQLAGRLGESSGATSYHLRRLGAYGWVEDVPERGTGRERWWQAAYQGMRIDRVEDFLDHPDPEVRGAMDAYVHEIAADHAMEVSTFVGTLHELPAEWRRSWDLSNWRLRLTPELMRELSERVHELVESYQDKIPEAAEAAEAAEGTGEGGEDAEVENVRVHFHVFARRRPE